MWSAALATQARRSDHAGLWNVVQVM